MPHVNITFHRLADENFKPDSELYLESLGIIGWVTIFIMIIIMIIMIVIIG